MTGFNDVVYATVATLALLVLAACVIVIFRAKFCHPFVLLLVLVVSLSNLGFLLSGLQRLTQHADLTIGLAPVLLSQALGICVLGWIVWDVRKSWRR